MENKKALITINEMSDELSLRTFFLLMKEDFLNYWNLLWSDIPMRIFQTGLVVLLFGMVSSILIFGYKKGGKYSLRLLLIEYVLLIYCSTVFFRWSKGAVEYSFIPFWSYRDYFNGVNDKLLVENIMNVVVFVPVGLLIGASYRAMTWKKVIKIGICLSVGIEVLQFVFRKGFSEVDDVMHNSIGCLIGYGIYRLLTRVYSYCYGCVRIK